MSYVLEGWKWSRNETGVTYGTQSGTITWNMDVTAFASSAFQIADFASSPGLDAFSITQFTAAAFDAFNAWAAVADLDLVYDPTLSDPDILLTVGDASGTRIGEASVSSTIRPTESIATVNTTTIVFDFAQVWMPFQSFGVQAGALNFYNVALHEIGHALGLGHPPDASQVMFETYTTDGDLNLNFGDINGIQFIYGNTGRIDVEGTGGDDFLDRAFFEVEKAYVFKGLGGNDTIDGGTRDDELHGGPGNDVLRGSPGADFYSGGPGNDILDSFYFFQDGSGEFLDNPPVQEIMVDTLGTNQFFASDGNDLLLGGFGTNEMNGFGGNDVIIGGIGDDELRGGSGNDVLIGDVLANGPGGNDRFDGGTGDDLLQGGQGADVFEFEIDEGNDTVGRISVDMFDAGTARVTGRDYEPGVDRIEFEFGIFTSASDVLAATENVDGSAVISGGGMTMTLFGVSVDELSDADFIFLTA